MQRAHVNLAAIAERARYCRQKEKGVKTGCEARRYLYFSYCREFLGWSNDLPNKTIICYTRLVGEKAYRDQLADNLNVHNLDSIAEISGYGGGSSFDKNLSRNSPSELLNRYRQQHIDVEILELLVGRAAIREACSREFGYNLSDICEQISNGDFR